MRADHQIPHEQARLAFETRAGRRIGRKPALLVERRLRSRPAAPAARAMFFRRRRRHSPNESENRRFGNPSRSCRAIPPHPDPNAKPALARTFAPLTVAEALGLERTFARINRARRLAKDFEAAIESALARLLIALAFLLTRILARLACHDP
jgi:hypothetical protein